VIATIDTNILVYASHEGSQLHPRARDLLEHVAAGPELLVMLWPAIMGYLRIATHPAIFARPLTVDEATGNVASLLGRRHVRALGETPGFWDTYGTATAGVAPRGNLVPDAHLVALMRQHGVSVIWTHDRDFRKFDGITVKDPFDARYADGFA
jgi:uncharacterized protein